MKHYTREELDQYRHKDMSFILRLICRAHLSICSQCRQKLSKLHDDDTLLRRLKDSLNMLNIESNSLTYQKIDTTIHELTNKESSV